MVVQSGVFEAEHELSELRASLQSEQDGLERRAASLAEEASRQRKKSEQLESQRAKMESERSAWADGAAGRRDAEAQLAESSGDDCTPQGAPAACRSSFMGSTLS